MIDKVIATEVQHQQMQQAFFAQREKTGPYVRPKVYQPQKEPEAGRLKVIYVEPGAAHLVFADEIAPTKELDERYREVRKKLFGRTHDVESVEYSQVAAGSATSGYRTPEGVKTMIKFVGNGAFLNLYETSLHWTDLREDTGSIFSETWNHMLSAGGKWLNVFFRGGYRHIEVPYIQGDRAAAEAWKEAEDAK